MDTSIKFTMLNNQFKNKVVCIKAFRRMTGLGLKDAKHFVERVGEERYVTEALPLIDLNHEVFTQMIEGGIEAKVLDPRFEMTDAIQKIAEQALAERDFTIATPLVELLETLNNQTITRTI